MDSWLEKLTAWLLDLIKGVFNALVTFFHDIALWIFDAILQGVAGVVAAIPAPSFLTGGVNVGTMLSVFPPLTLYYLQALNIPACLSVIAAGVLFRLTRKAVTLGQW